MEAPAGMEEEINFREEVLETPEERVWTLEAFLRHMRAQMVREVF